MCENCHKNYLAFCFLFVQNKMCLSPRIKSNQITATTVHFCFAFTKIQTDCTTDMPLEYIYYI